MTCGALQAEMETHLMASLSSPLGLQKTRLEKSALLPSIMQSLRTPCLRKLRVGVCRFIPTIRVAKWGTFLFGDNTIENPGITPGIVLFVLFMLFNLSWILDHTPKLARSAATSIGNGSRAIAESRGGQIISSGAARCWAALYGCGTQSDRGATRHSLNDSIGNIDPADLESADYGQSRPLLLDHKASHTS